MKKPRASLRRQLAIGTFATVFVPSALLGWFVYRHVETDFRNIEIHHAENELARSTNLLNLRLADLQRTVRDYAYWDLMYSFANSPDPAFVRENASSTSVAGLGAELWMVRSPSGKRLACLFVDRESSKSQPWTLGLEQLFSAPSEFARVSTGERRGLYLSRDEIWMVASAPILRSDRTGEPRGEFILAARAGVWEARRLSESLRIHVQFFSSEPSRPHNAIDRGDGVWVALSEQRATGCQAVRSPDGQIAGWIVLQFERPFYRTISSLLVVVATAIALMAFGSAVGSALWFSKRLVGPLEALRDSVAAVGQSPAASFACTDQREDEIGQIARSIAFTVQNLATFRAIVEAVPAFVLLFDSDRRCLYANAFSKTWFGKDPAREGLLWERLWESEEGLQLAEGSHGRAAAADGSKRIVWYQATRVTLDGAEVWLITGIDATAQAEAEQAAALARRALEASPMPVFLLHPNGLIDWANEAANGLSSDGPLPPSFLAAQFDDAFWVRATEREAPVAVCGRLQGASEIELEGAAVLLETHDGPRVCAFLHDSSLLRQAVRDLEAKEHWFRTVVDELAVGLLLLDDQGRIERSNRAARELFRREAGKLEGADLRDLPIRWPLEIDRLLKFRSSGDPYRTECSVSAGDDERRLEATVFRVQHQVGLLFYDQTERIAAKEALSETIQASVDYQRLFEGSPEGALLLHPDLSVRRCNQAWSNLTGWPEARDKAFLEAFVESDREPLRRALENCLRSGDGHAKVEARLRSSEGVLRWMQVVAVASREPAELLVSVHDISAARQEQQKLRQTVEHLDKLAAAFDSLPTFFAIADRTGRILVVNEALGKALNRDAIEAVGASLTDLVHADDGPAWSEALASVERTGATLQGFLSKLDPGAGQSLWVSWQASLDAERGLLYVSGQDVTLLAESRRKHARDAGKLREIFSAIREAVVATDASGRIRFWSDSAERIFGFSSKMASGRRLVDLVATPEDAERLEVNFELSKTLVHMDLTATCRTQEGRTIDVDGVIRWLNLEAEEPTAVWVLRDATADLAERNQLLATNSRFTHVEQSLQESSTSVWSWTAEEPFETEWCFGNWRAVSESAAPPTLLSMVSGLDRDWLVEGLQRAISEEKPEYEATFRAKVAGGPRWVRAKFLLPSHHGDRSIRCVLEEVTEWKRIEDSVREQNHELQRLRTMLEERSTILAQQTERLGASLRESESARRKFEAAAQRYRKFVDSLPVACIVCDAEGKVVEWNQAAQRLFEWHPHEAIGKELTGLIAHSPLESHDWTDLVRRTLRGESWPTVERPFRKPSGAQGWVLVGTIGLNDVDGVPSGALFACYDISRRKEEEAQREERAMQVHELAAKLAETQAELDRLRSLLNPPTADAA